jgi:hypothetical protein
MSEKRQLGKYIAKHENKEEFTVGTLLLMTTTNRKTAIKSYEVNLKEIQGNS